MRVEVKNLWFGYNSTPVLKNISIEASPGKVTVIIGPNGAGKSTLLKCIAGLLKPSGRVLLNGKEFRREHISRLISYIPQDHSIGAVLTVFETVLLGRINFLSWRINKRDLEVVMRVLRELRIEGLASRYISELSGGQRQMVFIAQALAREPKVLLMDEPVSNLDIRHQLEILNLIKKVTKDNTMTTILVLHDLNLAARYADELIVLRKGEVYNRGNPNSVLTEDMIRDVYGVHAKVGNDGGVPQVTPLKPLANGERLMEWERTEKVNTWLQAAHLSTLCGKDNSRKKANTRL